MSSDYADASTPHRVQYIEHDSQKVESFYMLFGGFLDNDFTKELFLNIKSRAELSAFLKIQYNSLRYYIYGMSNEQKYYTFTIKKKNGHDRRIDAPDKRLKLVQRRLADIFNSIYEPKVCTFGFVPKRDIIDNASQHTKKRYIVNIDLKDFFAQINFGRVRGTFIAKPYCLPEEVATFITQIVCYNGSLPQGAPTSPIVTNIVCKPLDNQMLRLAKHFHCQYTRYADDLTFSFYSLNLPNEIAYSSNGIAKVGSALLSKIRHCGFDINESKVRIYCYDQHQEVTGLTVNERVNVNRRYLRRIRAILNNCIKTGIYETAKKYISLGFCRSKEIQALIADEENQDRVIRWFSSVLRGNLEFIKNVRGSDDFLFQSLAEKYNIAFETECFDVSRLNHINATINNNVFVFNPINEGKQGSCFFLEGYGLITNHHVAKTADRFEIICHSREGNIVISEVCISRDILFYDEDIDYAVISFYKTANPFAIGRSEDLKIGDRLTIVGFPEYYEGDTPNRQNCELISISKHLNTALYLVSGRIVHGFSGGIVLNENKEIVGLIRSGVENDSEAGDNIKQGFIPIHLVISSIENKRAEKNATNE